MWTTVDHWAFDGRRLRDIRISFSSIEVDQKKKSVDFGLTYDERTDKFPVLDDSSITCLISNEEYFKKHSRHKISCNLKQIERVSYYKIYFIETSTFLSLWLTISSLTIYNNNNLQKKKNNKKTRFVILYYFEWNDLIFLAVVQIF